MRLIVPIFAFLCLSFGQVTQAEVRATTTLKSGTEVSHSARFPALFVKKGSPPAAGLEPGAFSTTWTGKLKIDQRARLFFSFEGKGEAVLSIDGEEVLALKGDLSSEKSARLRLNPGEIPLSVTYTSPEDGSGQFRLFWEGRDFAREAIPPKAFVASTDQPVPDPAHLIAEHHCVKCHQADDILSQPHFLPELTNDGPDLSDIGERRQAEWLTRWIAQPDKLKPTTTMPALVDHTKAEGAQEAADIAAYLATLKKNEPAKAAEIPAELAKKGGAHFHHLGCVACHTLPAVSEIDYDHFRIPLNNVATKFTPGTLEKFLKKPDAHWKSIKMPDFRFSDDEAKELAAFLTKEATGRHTPDPSEFAPGSAERGAELVKSLNCANCHDGLPSAEKDFSAPSFSELAKLATWDEKGCLAPDEKRGHAPRLILNEAEKEALTKTKNFLPELSHDTPAAYAERQLHALRCVACHTHDAENPYLSLLHPESNQLVAHLENPEQVDQSRPPLTSIGEMLKTPYFEKMLDGSVTPSPRPWLQMRMPAFHLHAKRLPVGFAAQHGLDVSKTDDNPVDTEKAKAGAELVSLAGYACTTCHAAGEDKALAVFEVAGINFDQVHRRLRPEYFHRWMHNPSRVVPDTKMPKYTQADGSAIRTDLMEGDSKKQFDAIWEYLKSLDEK